MDWSKFFAEKERIRQNLNEWTDNVILSDGTVGPISGSNADMPESQDELADYNNGISEWIELDPLQTLKKAFPEEYL